MSLRLYIGEMVSLIIPAVPFESVLVSSTSKGWLQFYFALRMFFVHHGWISPFCSLSLHFLRMSGVPMCQRGLQLHLSHVLPPEGATGLCLREVSCLFCACSFNAAPHFLANAGCWTKQTFGQWNTVQSLLTVRTKHVLTFSLPLAFTSSGFLTWAGVVAVIISGHWCVFHKLVLSLLRTT